SRVETVAALTAHKMGREHEDLVVVSGRVASGLVFSATVDWLTPTKTRRTRILGERGMLLADTLTADLTFFANADVTSEWGAAQDPAVVDAVNAGEPPFPGEAGLAEALQETVGARRLRASTRTTDAVAAGPDLVVAVPPLAVDRRARPGWRALDAAIRAIGDGLQPGTTVSVETTVPLHTTRSRLAPLLEQASGLIAERHFHLVFSPERVYSG